MGILKEILIYFPLFILTLGQSPNLVESSLGRAVFSSVILLPSLFGMVKRLMRPVSKKAYAGILLILSFLFFLYLLYLHLGLISYQVLLLFSVLSVLILYKNYSKVAESLFSLLFFCCAYLTINGFDWTHLLQLRILPIAVASGFFPFIFRSRTDHPWAFLPFFLFFIPVFFVNDTLMYAWLFPMIWLPKIIIDRWFPGRAVWGDVLTGVGLTGYLIYYLLYATHLIQALTGGL